MTEGTAWEIYAVMKGGKLVRVVAKDPNKPIVVDITEELARTLHHARSAPPSTDGEDQKQ